jgi:membrane protein DedA with SNARE-associated domain
MEGIIASILVYRYFILIPGAIIEGPILSVISGMLIHIDILQFWPTYLLLMTGDLIGDTLWYFVGYHWGKKFVVRYGKYFSITEQSLDIVSHIYHKYHNAIIPISKVCMGFGFPGAVLTTAGIIKIPYRKFLFLNFLGQIFWTGGLLAIGYFLGDLFHKVDASFKWVSIIGISVLVVAILFGVGNYIRKRTLEKYS